MKIGDSFLCVNSLHDTFTKGKIYKVKIIGRYQGLATFAFDNEFPFYVDPIASKEYNDFSWDDHFINIKDTRRRKLKKIEKNNKR